MKIQLHPHARERMAERGASEAEVIEAVKAGESVPLRLGRIAFRRNFAYNSNWRGKLYGTKQVEAIAVREEETLLVITVVVRYF